MGSAACDAADGTWNAESFAQELAQAKLGKDYKRLKKLLVEVAESNYKLRSQWKAPSTRLFTHQECMYLNYHCNGGTVPEISFSAMSTVDALLCLAQDKRRVVSGLNFANGKDVGGGYKNGSTAQEEDLCRRIPALYTSLYRASKDGLYPFGPSTCRTPDHPVKYADVLFTPGLTIAREGEEAGFRILPRAQQVQVSLIAAAAPNINFASDVSEPSLIYQTIQSIFLAPKLAQPNTTTLVLGAWGCGAFGGDPSSMAALFVQALVRDNLGQHYREVHFAIPKTSPTDVNHDTFRAVFKEHRVKVKSM